MKRKEKEVDDREFRELLDLFRENNLTQYGIDRLYGAIIDRDGEKNKEIAELKKTIKKSTEISSKNIIKVQILKEEIKEKDKEIEKLNNIINELEKYLIEQVEKSYSNDYDNVLDKLDELKGSE